MTKIIGFDTYDVRFPTSRNLDGSDAMNASPDYSAAYLIVRTDGPDELAGHAYVFTIGRGNDIQLNAVRALEPFLVGRDVDETLDDLGGLSRRLVGDSPLRWLGPERGVVHMAIGAVLNACWDLAARRAGKPLWRLLADLTPEQVVDLVDFRYISDALTREEALDLMQQAVPGRAGRIAALERDGYPAYTTAPGWLGYSDERLAALSAEAVAEGFTQIKLKVGARITDDIRRIGIARQVVGDQVAIALDANQVWDVPTAIAWMRELAPLGPAWIEEPTSPDDILGLARIRREIDPVRVATGEHVSNRVIFKQLLQAGAIDVMQIDACRVAGVNENIANLLLAAKFGVPVCPHAGGVGLCEMVQHLSMFDFAAVSTAVTGRQIEWIDHLHGHFTNPARVERGRYITPTAPGGSAELRPESVKEFSFLEAAWACGIRAFDTAPHYGAGLSEQRLGEFLGGKPRHQFVISTKVGRRLVAAGADAQPEGAEGFYGAPRLRRVRDYSRDGVLASLQASLTRLGLDRIDIALIHDPDDHAVEALDGAFPALAELRAAGVLGAIGVGMNQAPLLEWFVRRADLDCVLVAGRYSLLDGQAAATLFPACQRRGVAVLAGGIFNSGLLVCPEPGATYDYAPAPAALLDRARR